MGRPPIELANDIRDALELLAIEHGVSPSDLANTALRAWLERSEDEERKVREGIAAIDAGQVIAHDRVKHWLSTWGSDSEAPRPR